MVDARGARTAQVPGVDPRIAPLLLTWFRREARPLPWRSRPTPYRTWIAEVLLQQTRVAQAVPYFERLTARFPRVCDLADASEEEVLKLWEGAGYYARARNLHRAAREIVDRYDGTLPGRREELARLPGVGPYISAAVASLAFGERVLALEANGLRVGARWTAEPGDVRRPAVRRRLARTLEQLLPIRNPGRFNEALMELGETLCTPRRPRCPECPVRRHCRALRELPDPGAIPRGRSSRGKPSVEAAVIAVRQDSRWLVQRRPADGLLGGLWEFPGGKLRPREPPEGAARRELWEETGIRARHLVPAGTLRHEYSHFRVRLHLFYLDRRESGKTAPTELPRRWVTDREFDRLPRPRATIRAMERFRRLAR